MPHLTAREGVAAALAAGKVAGISEEFLGATVLAWGNCVGDLMSCLAVARAGQAGMAVAACFAGQGGYPEQAPAHEPRPRVCMSIHHGVVLRCGLECLL